MPVIQAFNQVKLLLRVLKNLRWIYILQYIN